MAKMKRPEGFEVARDVQMLLDLCLVGGIPRSEAYALVNRQREQRAYDRARARGASEDDARAEGEAAKLSSRMFRRDLAKARASLEELKNEKARMICIQRLAEIEREREKLRAAEERCWTELNRSGRETLASSSTRTRRTAGGEEAAFDDSVQQVEEVRSADPRWMERIEALIFKRYQMGFEAFRLRLLIGEEVPQDLRQLVELAEQGSAEAAERLRGHELGQLYGFEARAAPDRGTSRSRIQLLTGFRAGSGPPGDQPNGGGHFSFEVVAVDVEEKT